MMQRIKTKLSRFHVGRLREALDHLLSNNIDADAKELIGSIDVMWINGNTYVSITDSNGNIVMTCIEEVKEKSDG